MTIKSIVKSIALGILASALLTLGAYIHERNIQDACNQNHRTGNTTWINELYCVPVDNLWNRFD